MILPSFPSDLSNNKLTSIPAGGDFQGITISKALDLSNNRITSIRTGDFKALSCKNLWAAVYFCIILCLNLPLICSASSLNCLMPGSKAWIEGYFNDEYPVIIRRDITHPSSCITLIDEICCCNLCQYISRIFPTSQYDQNEEWLWFVLLIESHEISFPMPLVTLCAMLSHVILLLVFSPLSTAFLYSVHLRFIRNLNDNSISYIEPDGLHQVTVFDDGDFSNNNLKEIQSYAFNQTSFK